MKSTNNNLLNLVYRLIASGIILFICTQITLAYVIAFYLIPSDKQMRMSRESDCVRMGIELNRESYLITSMKRSNNCSLTKIMTSFESYAGFKNGLLDAVKTDEITAKFLMEKGNAKPFAFLFEEELRSPQRERLVLVTQNSKAGFFEQTKGQSLVLSAIPQSLRHILFTEFLNQRTKDYNTWFSKVAVTGSDHAALEKVLKGTWDVAGVSEKDYTDFLKEKGELAGDLRVLWYSNPYSRNVIMVRKDLKENQLEQLKTILSAEDDTRLSWHFFDESLEELNEWKFTVRGKDFIYSEDHFKLGMNL